MGYNMQYKTFKGTAKQAIESGLKINGRMVDAIGLGQMAKHHIIDVAGKAEKAPTQRGKAAVIFEVKGREGFEVEYC